ncbi:MAG: PD-(D/E)XK nuclease family protein, partial [Deltaproteobacteria bacterium]|nr:PD-(D/E)XK nuclease family protein [Deltaproteobacteria bacterium]
MNDFKNTYVSYSRLSRFEQCPLAFKLHYIDKLKSEPGPPLVFGSAIHLILERLIDEHVKAGKPGPLSKNRAFELLKDVFVEMKITGAELFDDGMSILRRFVANQEIIEPTQVLAIEREFKIQAGAYTVLGYIDRVDRIDNDTVRIIDYKTNRMLFTRNEVDESLQFSIYCIAAKQLWPWAKNILLSFDMLRHGVTLTTTRTDEQLESALAYVETLSRLTEEVNDYPAKLNTNCVYCDHSKLCPVYNEVLQNRKTPDFEELTDIEDIAKEREELAKVAKILYARKKK